jgi:hypothetical protein
MAVADQVETVVLAELILVAVAVEELGKQLLADLADLGL